jgi:anti-sigma factor RsiW
VAQHVRSLQLDHLTDVTSTDQHTVKPWFAGKLDFSPPVVDLASAGFPLAGGRLDQLDGRPAASLVFHRRQHVINLFIWPASARALASQATRRAGFNVQAWSKDGLNFLAVSELPAEELANFTSTFRAATN